MMVSKPKQGLYVRNACAPIAGRHVPPQRSHIARRFHEITSLLNVSLSIAGEMPGKRPGARAARRAQPVGSALVIRRARCLQIATLRMPAVLFNRNRSTCDRT